MKEQLLEIIELVSNRDTFILGVNLFVKSIDKSLYRDYILDRYNDNIRCMIVYLNDNPMLLNAAKEIGYLSINNDFYFMTTLGPDVLDKRFIIYEKKL